MKSISNIDFEQAHIFIAWLLNAGDAGYPVSKKIIHALDNYKVVA